MMQQSRARHHDVDLLLEKMTMPAGGEIARRYSLDIQADRVAPYVSAYVRHLPTNRAPEAVIKGCGVADVHLADRHDASSSTGIANHDYAVIMSRASRISIGNSSVDNAKGQASRSPANTRHVKP